MVYSLSFSLFYIYFKNLNIKKKKKKKRDSFSHLSLFGNQFCMYNLSSVWLLFSILGEKHIFIFTYTSHFSYCVGQTWKDLTVGWF